jgi:hypothetical protein
VDQAANTATLKPHTQIISVSCKSYPTFIDTVVTSVAGPDPTGSKSFSVTLIVDSSPTCYSTVENENFLNKFLKLHANTTSDGYIKKYDANTNSSDVQIKYK